MKTRPDELRELAELPGVWDHPCVGLKHGLKAAADEIERLDAEVNRLREELAAQLRKAAEVEPEGLVESIPYPGEKGFAEWLRGGTDGDGDADGDGDVAAKGK